MWAARKTVWLILLAGLALGLRVWVVLALRTDHAGPIAYEHGRIAENLLAGRGFSIELLGAEGPTSQQAPVYPLLLAASYACFGVGSPEATLAVQLLQCLAGMGMVLVVVWLAWSLVPDQPALGWIAGLGAAAYPTHLYMVTHLQVAPWAALVLTLFLAVVVSPRWQSRPAGAVLAGVLAGTLLLIEPVLALALPVGALAYWLGQRKAGRLDASSPAGGEVSLAGCHGHARAAMLCKPVDRPPAHDNRGHGTRHGTRSHGFGLWGSLGRVALMAGVAAAVISPWIVRNWLVHGELVFIKSTLGYAFWQGNNPASWGTDKIPKASAERLRAEHDGTSSGMDRALWEARHETLYIDDVALSAEDHRQLGQLSEPERCRVLGHRAWEFVREHPGHYARLCVTRLGYFLAFDVTNPKAANRLYRAATITWLVLALVGLLMSLGRWRALWPTYVIFALMTLFHALVITSVRFRIPLEPMTFVWAAAALEPLAERLGARRPIRIYRPGQSPHDPFAPKAILKGPHYDARTKALRRRAG